MFWEPVHNADAFRRAGHREVLPAGREMDAGRYVALVESGICGLTTVTPEGNERTYLYFKPGDLVGFLRHVLHQDKFPRAHFYRTRNRVVAKSRVELTLIDKDAFLDLTRRHAGCHQDFTISLAQNLANLMEHSALVSCESAPIRICAMLLEFCEPEGERSVLPACFTQGEISAFLALHKITVAKVLGSLTEAGYIRRTGRRLEVVEPARLTQVAERQLCIRY